MWSSLTLRRQDKHGKGDTDAAEGREKVNDTVNKKLTRAATFCFDSDYKDKKKKTKWLKNLPNIKKGVIKNKSEKYKLEDYKIRQEEDKNECLPVRARFVF